MAKIEKGVIVTRYRRFAYFFFKWFDKKPRTGTLDTLYKAGIQMLPGMYVGTIAVTAVMAGILSLVGSVLVFTFVFKTPLASLLTIAISGSAVMVGAVALPVMTVNKITAKRVSID